MSLVLKMLENSIEGTDEFQALINHLPADLDATYEKILSKSPKPEKARKILVKQQMGRCCYWWMVYTLYTEGRGIRK